MVPRAFAEKLVKSSPSKRLDLLRPDGLPPTAEIAEALQQLCYEAWTDEPKKVAKIADAAADLADRSGQPEVRGYADWIKAIDRLVDGDLDGCIALINASEAGFFAIGKEHLAAKTQTAKLYAQAMLGRYDEAVASGLRAREIFVRHSDEYSAGKIEHNIGNLYWRRDRYDDAEPYLESSRERFERIGDQRQLAMVENCQAFVKTQQNNFAEAEAIYARALERADAEDLTVTVAEIEVGLSNLYLFQAKYGLALRFMEQARRRYEALGMANQSAICSLELADIYLELNLLPEADRLYDDAANRFEQLKMQAELARSLIGRAKASLAIGTGGSPDAFLARSEELYLKEKNIVAVAAVRLTRSQMMIAGGDLDAAFAEAQTARASLERSRNERLELFAEWLVAEIASSRGHTDEAVASLAATLEKAQNRQPDTAALCHASIGRLTDDEKHLIAAVELIEDSRSQINADELRMSYFSRRLAPYNQLVRINIAKGDAGKAFGWHERSRARTLSDVAETTPSATTPAKGDARGDAADNIRRSINQLYRRINRMERVLDQDRERILSLQEQARTLEAEYAELKRRNSSMSKGFSSRSDLDIEKLCDSLNGNVLVEFAAIDGQITAFVAGKNGLEMMSAYVSESELSSEIRQFLFQIGSGRLASQMTEANRAEIDRRLRLRSRRIYDLLMRPIENVASRGDLIVVPTGRLNYLPFNALHDGDSYLIERRAVSYSPSASLLLRCLESPSPDVSRSLVAGVSDPSIPHVDREIDMVAKIVEAADVLRGDDVTFDSLRSNVRDKGLIHFACHGKFRSDNPAFSSIVLRDEELTPSEISAFHLKNSIIALSACDTGRNGVIGGEEIVGLARAFFGAGATSLLTALWPVNDEVTFDLMRSFYRSLTSNIGISRSLCLAQRKLIATGMHPHFWAPFMLWGRP